MFSDGSPEAPAYDPKNYGCEFHLYSTGYIRRALELKLRSWQEKRSPLLSRPLFTLVAEQVADPRRLRDSVIFYSLSLPRAARASVSCRSRLHTFGNLVCLASRAND